MGWKHFLIDVESALDDEAAFAIAQDYILSGHTDWLNWDSISLVRLLLYLIARGYEMTVGFICTIDVNYVLAYLNDPSRRRMSNDLRKYKLNEWNTTIRRIFNYFNFVVKGSENPEII